MFPTMHLHGKFPHKALERAEKSPMFKLSESRGVALKISQGGQTFKNVFQEGGSRPKNLKTSQKPSFQDFFYFSRFSRGGSREGRGQAFTPLSESIFSGQKRLKPAKNAKKILV